MADTYSTDDIVERLDQLIAIMKLANADKLNAFKEKISKDNVSQAIFELLEKGALDYSTLAAEAARITGKSDRTAKSRISALTEEKILSKKRLDGKTVYYNSGILE